MMMRAVVFALLTLFIAIPAQAKPYGAFDVDPNCRNVPEWVEFSGLPSWTSVDDMRSAARCSERIGIKWVLKFGFDSIVNTENVAREVRTRAVISNLLPFVIALQFSEEWYNQPGRWGPVGYATNDAIAAYGGEQHRILKQVFGLPVVYVDNFVNSNRQYGVANYKPLPPHTDVLAIETYVPKGGSWDLHVKPFVEYTIATTTQPIVLIAQTFKHPWHWHDMWQTGPSRSDGEKFKLLLQHPRVIAAWLFTWRDRDNGIVGVESNPQWLEWFR